MTTRTRSKPIKWKRTSDGGTYRGGGYELLSDDAGWIVRIARGDVIDLCTSITVAKRCAERHRRGR